MKAANVLADGPSIDHLKESDFLDGPVIAINLSIRLRAQGIPIDYWAMVDHPGLLWDWSEPYRLLTPDLIYIVIENHIKPMVDLIGLNEAGEPLKPIVMQDSPFLDVVLPGEGRLEVVDGKRVLCNSLIWALHWLLTERCEHVRIFGCDMKGTGSAGHSVPHWVWIEKEDKAHKARWMAERWGMSAVMRQFRRRGWRVERFHTSYKT